MATFHRKKTTVEAIQYKGGLVSAAKVIELFGLEEDCYKAKEKELYVDGSRVFEGSWVVREPFFGRDIFRFLSSEEFNAIFEPSTPVGLPERSISRVVKYEGAAMPLGDGSYAIAHPDKPAEILSRDGKREMIDTGIGIFPASQSVKITDPSRL